MGPIKRQLRTIVTNKLQLDWETITRNFNRGNGTKYETDKEMLLDLRAKKISMRKIANMAGVSLVSVWRRIKIFS
jgi:hypothetical protein